MKMQKAQDIRHEIAAGADMCARLRSGLCRSADGSRLMARGWKAFTLPEMLVTIAVVAIVTVIAVPAFYSIRENFNSTGADTLISAAISTAKAMAAREQKYVGIRFQCAPDPMDPERLGPQYMIFIVHDPTLSASGFRAARGVAPIRLPANLGVMDLYVKNAYASGASDKRIAGDADLSTPVQVWDTTTFSIIFSPSGRLVTREVRVWNRDDSASNTSEDMVFNTKANVDLGLQASPVIPPGMTGQGMFYQDDDIIRGFGQEYSRGSFVIYDRRNFLRLGAGTAYSSYVEYLEKTQRLHINPYTGTIIENQSRRNAIR